MTAPTPLVPGEKRSSSSKLCPSPPGQEPTHFSTELLSCFLEREWRQHIAHAALGGGKLLGSPVPVYLSSGPSRRTLGLCVTSQASLRAYSHGVVLKCSVLSERALKHCMINGTPAKNHTSKIDCIYFPGASVSADFFGARQSF